MDTEGPYANLIIFLIVLALILLNALVNMIFSSLTSLNHQKLREMVENGDSKAKDVLILSQDQQRLMQSQNFQDGVLSIITIAFLLLNIKDSLKKRIRFYANAYNDSYGNCFCSYKKNFCQYDSSKNWN